MKQRSRARANIHVCTEHSFSEAPLQPTQLLCSVLGRVQAPHAEAPSTLQYESESESRSGVSKSFRPMDYTVHGILQARILEWGAAPFSRGSSQSKDRTQVFALQADSLLSEPSEKLCTFNSAYYFFHFKYVVNIFPPYYTFFRKHDFNHFIAFRH